MNKVLPLPILLLFIGSCAQVDYIGKTYAPSDNVEIFYSENDTEYAYEVMGYAISSGSEFISVDKLKNELLKEARKNGADAIIISGIDRDREYDESGFDTEMQIKAAFIKYK